MKTWMSVGISGMMLFTFLAGCSSAPKANLARKVASVSEVTKIPPTDDPAFMNMSAVSSMTDLRSPSGDSIPVVSLYNGPEINPINFVISFSNGEADGRGMDSYYIPAYLDFTQEIKLSGTTVVITGNQNDPIENKKIGITLKITFMTKEGDRLKDLVVETTVGPAFVTHAPVTVPSAFQCFGAEPDWSLSISKSGLKLKSVAGSAFAGTFPAAKMQTPAGFSAGNVMVYNTKNTSTGKSMQVVINHSPKGCSDGMSEETFPYSVTAITSQWVISGCCRAK